MISSRVEGGWRNVQRKVLAPRLHGGPAGVERATQCIVDIRRGTLESQLPRAAPRSVKQIVDETGHLNDLPLDDALEFCQQRLVVAATVEQSRGIAYRVEWIAQL